MRNGVAGMGVAPPYNETQLHVVSPCNFAVIKGTKELVPLVARRRGYCPSPLPPGEFQQQRIGLVRREIHVALLIPFVFAPFLWMYLVVWRIGLPLMERHFTVCSNAAVIIGGPNGH